MAKTRVGGAPARQAARSTKWQSSPTMRPPPSSGRWVQCVIGMAPALTRITIVADEDRRASAETILRTCGAKRRLKPTVSRPPDSHCAATT